jgi:hypothetical protein
LESREIIGFVLQRERRLQFKDALREISAFDYIAQRAVAPEEGATLVTN